MSHHSPRRTPFQRPGHWLTDGRVAVIAVMCLVMSGLGGFLDAAAADEPDPATSSASAEPTPSAPTDAPSPAAEPTATADPAVPSASATAAEAPSHPYLVTFAETTSAAEGDALLSGVGAAAVSSIPQLHLASTSLTDVAVDSLRADSAVVRVEADRIREVQGTPSDPAYDNQWALPKIGWDSAYGTVEPAGSAKVAILDTGIDATDDLATAWSAARR